MIFFFIDVVVVVFVCVCVWCAVCFNLILKKEGMCTF